MLLVALRGLPTRLLDAEKVAERKETFGRM